MRMPAPRGQAAHLEHRVVGDVGFERRPEAREGALVLARLEGRLQLGAHHVALRHRQGDGCRGRPDHRDRHERRRAEHPAGVGERRLDGAAAVIAAAVGDRDAHEPGDRRDEEREAGLDGECLVHDAEGDAGESSTRRRETAAAGRRVRSAMVTAEVEATSRGGRAARAAPGTSRRAPRS